MATRKEQHLCLEEQDMATKDSLFSQLCSPMLRMTCELPKRRFVLSNFVTFFFFFFIFNIDRRLKDYLRWNRPSEYKPPGGLYLEMALKYKVKQIKNGKFLSNYKLAQSILKRKLPSVHKPLKKGLGKYKPRGLFSEFYGICLFVCMYFADCLCTVLRL